MIRTSIMDFDCGLSLKINLNMIVYIVCVVLTIYGTHNIILQVIIVTYHISLYNSSSKKTWDILLQIHNYLISDIIQGKTFVPITILGNLLAIFALWSISFIILYGIDMKFPPFHNSNLYGFYVVSSNYKQQHVSINTSLWQEILIVHSTPSMIEQARLRATSILLVYYVI